MPGGYDVDIEALAGLVESISETAEQMKVASSALDKATKVDLGHPSINKAGEKFHDKWKYGIKQIEKHSKDTAETLDLARQEYAQTEQTNAALQQNMLGMLGGPAAAPASGGGSVGAS